MKLHASFVKSFVGTALFGAGITFATVYLAPRLHGSEVDFWGSLAASLFFGTIGGSFAALVLTPREVHWSDEEFTVKWLLGATKSYLWKDLDSWFPFGEGTLVLRFRTAPNILQIAHAGLDDGDYSKLISFLNEDYSNLIADYDLAGEPKRLPRSKK